MIRRILHIIRSKPTAAQKESIAPMFEFEQALGEVPGAMFGDVCPLSHFFAPGLCVRAMLMPAGLTLTSKIHATTHPFFIMSGQVAIKEDSGKWRYVTGPNFVMTQAGSKRAIHSFTEAVFVAVYATKETDIKKIENEVIAKPGDYLPQNRRKPIWFG